MRHTPGGEVRQLLMADDAIDPLRPEILLYIPHEDGS
jgi:hypothetical protein